MLRHMLQLYLLTGCCYCTLQCESPLRFSDIFTKRCGTFSPNFTCLLYVPNATVTKLCHIKCDHPACVSADGHFEHMTWTGWSHLIWHNFVKVAGNWIKIRTKIGTKNLHPFCQKTPREKFWLTLYMTYFTKGAGWAAPGRAWTLAGINGPGLKNFGSPQAGLGLNTNGPGRAEITRPMYGSNVNIVITTVLQPMWTQYLNVTDRQTDRLTDGEMTCHGNTMLCLASRGNT